MKKHLMAILILILFYASSFEGHSQTNSIEKGLAIDEVVRLRQDILKAIQNDKTNEAKLLKDSLWYAQPNPEQYLSNKEYYLILFLIADFDEILDSISDSWHLQSNESEFPDISKSLEIEVNNRLITIINQITDEKYSITKQNDLSFFLDWWCDFSKLFQKETYADSVFFKQQLLPNAWISRTEIGFETFGFIRSDRNQNQINRNSLKIKFSHAIIYFFNDSIVVGNKIKLRQSFLGKEKLVLDEKAYPAKKVKFYDDGITFKANTSKEGKKPRFIQREFSGIINYFKGENHTNISYSEIRFYTPGFYTGSYYNPGTYTSVRQIKSVQQNLEHYYNFGYGDIKEVTYENLLKDIGHNAGSKYYLDTYKGGGRTTDLVNAIRAYNNYWIIKRSLWLQNRKL